MNLTETNRGLELQRGELEIVRVLLRRHLPEREVWAIGSRVQGKAKTYSDLDLVVLGEEPLTLSALAELAEEFSESDLPYKVDIVDWATTSEHFRQIIRQEYVVVQAQRLQAT
jgi:predicted nucleotidyltransferase